MNEDKKNSNHIVPVIFCESEFYVDKSGILKDCSNHRGREYTLEQLKYLIYLDKKGVSPKILIWPPAKEDWEKYINDPC